MSIASLDEQDERLTKEINNESKRKIEVEEKVNEILAQREQRKRKLMDQIYQLNMEIDSKEQKQKMTVEKVHEYEVALHDHSIETKKKLAEFSRFKKNIQTQLGFMKSTLQSIEKSQQSEQELQDEYKNNASSYEREIKSKEDELNTLKSMNAALSSRKILFMDFNRKIYEMMLLEQEKTVAEGLWDIFISELHDIASNKMSRQPQKTLQIMNSNSEWSQAISTFQITYNQEVVQKSEEFKKTKRKIHPKRNYVTRAESNSVNQPVIIDCVDNPINGNGNFNEGENELGSELSFTQLTSHQRNILTKTLISSLLKQVINQHGENYTRLLIEACFQEMKSETRFHHHIFFTRQPNSELYFPRQQKKTISKGFDTMDRSYFF